MTLNGVPLHEALEEIKQRTGMTFIAPLISPTSIVNLSASEAQFDEWTNALAFQLGAVPVFRSASRSIEFVPRNELGRMTFPQAEPGSHSPAKFWHYNSGSAIREIAIAERIDIAVPEGLGNTGFFDADLPDMSWENLIEAILETSGKHGKVMVESNGLVRVVPSSGKARH